MSAGWRVMPLSELCDLKPPKSIARSILNDDDEVSFVPMSDLRELQKRFEGKEVRRFSDVVSGYVYFGDGDVLCAKITPCFENGKLGVASGLKNGVGFGSSEFVVMRSRGELLPDYLFYFLSRDDFRQAGERVMTGAVGHKRVPKEFFEELEVPLPSLNEQKRIVAKLDRAFAALDRVRANVEANLADADEVFEKRLEQIFSRDHRDWKKKRLDEVCSITSALVDPRQSSYIDAIHVGAGNIESRTGNLSDLKTSREEQLVSGKFPFDESMVLYSKIRPYLEKVARPSFSGVCSADMYPLAPVEGQITRDFLFWLLLSRPFTDYAIKGSARAGMPKVNRDHLFQYETELPEIQEQRQIVANLDALQAEVFQIRSKYERDLSELDALRQSLLQTAFSGQLT